MNGKLLDELRTMAERQQVSGKVAFPVIFASLADIMESQSRIIDEVRRDREKLASNPMVRLGELITKKPAKVAVVTIVAVLVINCIGPLVLSALGIEIPLDELFIRP